MTIVSALSPISLAQFFYPSGKIVRPARLFFYKPNTEDAVLVYTEPELSVPYPQPVLTGGSGRVPPIYIGEEPYRIRVYDSNGSLVEDIEYLPGAAAVTTDPEEPGVPGQVLQTGDMFFAFAGTDTSRTGCVRANGGLIGPATFPVAGYEGVIERLNADTEALFTWLWGQDTVGALAVIPSRGTTSANDWAANKAIHLPDLRARALVGIDDMGMGLTGRLSGITTTPPVTAWSGGAGGFAAATMTTAQMPNHSHTVNKNTSGVVVNPSVTGVTVAAANAAEGATPLYGPYGAGPYGYLYPSATAAVVNTLLAPHSHVVNDPGHGHSIIEPSAGTGHDHTLVAEGSGAAMPTMPPFLLAVVYIKL